MSWMAAGSTSNPLLMAACLYIINGEPGQSMAMNPAEVSMRQLEPNRELLKASPVPVTINLMEHMLAQTRLQCQSSFQE